MIDNDDLNVRDVGGEMVVLQICKGKCEQTSSCANCALSHESLDPCAANCTAGVQLVDSVQGLLRFVSLRFQGRKSRPAGGGVRGRGPRIWNGGL